METKTTPVHPLLLGTTPGPWCARPMPGAGDFTIETDREYAGDRWWIADIGDSGHIGTEEREANAKLIAACPSLAAENALLADRLKEVEEVVDRLKKQVELCDYRDGLDHELRMNAAYLDLITIQFPTP